MGKRLGVGSLACLGAAALSPLLFNKALPAYVLFALALALSVLAGITGSRKWFILTGLLAAVLLLFVGFIAMVMEGSRVGG